MWDSEILPVKVLGDSGSGSEWSVAKGILYAAGLLDDKPIEPADIINMSLGMVDGSQTPEILKDAVDRAAEAGVIMVAAAGNNSSNYVSYPARFEEVIAVSALSPSHDGRPVLANYSNYGPEIELAAPGSNILSTVNENDIVSMSGTSMAAPQVAGLAGLMLAEGIPDNQIRDILQKTAIDLGDPGFNEEYGHGLINSYWSVNQAEEVIIIIGERNSRQFNAVKKLTIKISEQEFTINDVPAGEYEVMVWLDVRNSGDLENGDYFATSGMVELKEGEYSFELTAGEYY